MAPFSTAASSSNGSALMPSFKIYSLTSAPATHCPTGRRRRCCPRSDPTSAPSPTVGSAAEEPAGSQPNCSAFSKVSTSIRPRALPRSPIERRLPTPGAGAAPGSCRCQRYAAATPPFEASRLQVGIAPDHNRTARSRTQSRPWGLADLRWHPRGIYRSADDSRWDRPVWADRRRRCLASHELGTLNAASSKPSRLGALFEAPTLNAASRDLPRTQSMSSA